MTRKEQQAVTKKWQQESKLRETARKKRGIFCVPFAELDDYHRILADAKCKYSLVEAPAMPTVQFAAPGQGEPCAEKKRQHQDKIPDKGCSEDFYALVHTPINMSKALRIPKAKAAINKECD